MPLRKSLESPAQQSSVLTPITGIKAAQTSLQQRALHQIDTGVESLNSTSKARDQMEAQTNEDQGNMTIAQEVETDSVAEQQNDLAQEQAPTIEDLPDNLVSGNSLSVEELHDLLQEARAARASMTAARFGEQKTSAGKKMSLHCSKFQEPPIWRTVLQQITLRAVEIRRAASERASAQRQQHARLESCSLEDLPQIGQASDLKSQQQAEETSLHNGRDASLEIADQSFQKGEKILQENAVAQQLSTPHALNTASLLAGQTTVDACQRLSADLRKSAQGSAGIVISSFNLQWLKGIIAFLAWALK